MKSSFRLIVPAHLKERLFAHLFPGDGDEHGAVIAAGVVETDRGLTLLARDLFLAEDGKDYVPGQRGYRMLTGAFVTERIRYCRDQRLSYLAIHNHGGTNRVAFSADDLASHERGYPALLDIGRGNPVGALVFAREAVAGDLWLSKSRRLPLAEARVVGSSVQRLHPDPPVRPRGVDETYDRQARLFGDAGQDLLSRLKVGIIGAGGVGSLLVLYLARLGVGHLIVVDPERIEPSNLPRVVGSTRFDARTWLTTQERPHWVRKVGARFAARKVDIMGRVVRRASRRVHYEGIFGDFTVNEVAMRFRDCDFLFLAADSFQARLVFNALVHQYLIPAIQIGSKVPVDRSSGAVGQVYAVSRPVTPASGCLWCYGLIPPRRLQEEAATESELRAQRYVEEATIVAPSVITLNAAASGVAANDFLFAMTGLRSEDGLDDYLRFLPRSREIRWDEPRKDPTCLECGHRADSRFARGDSVSLPTR